MAMSAEERQQMLLTQPVEKIIPKMALPTICSMLITSIYNMADTYFVSQIGTAEATASGTSASAAVGIVFSVMAMIQALAFMFGMGSGTNVSHLLGMGKRKEAEVYSAVGFFSAVAAGVLIAVLGNVFNEPLMRLLGATETAMPYALDYARYIFLAAPFMMGSLSMNNLLRFQGLATYGMVGIISGGVLNMLLDPLLIFVFDMGIAGASIATAISQLTSFAILLVMCSTHADAITIHPRNYRPTKQMYAKILNNGLPSLGRQGIMSVSTSLLNNAAAVYGDPAIAAFAIVSRCLNFVNSTVVGFGQGFQPVCGFNYGARKYDRMHRAFSFSVKVTTIVLLVLGVAGFGLCRAGRHAVPPLRPGGHPHRHGNLPHSDSDRVGMGLYYAEQHVHAGDWLRHPLDDSGGSAAGLVPDSDAAGAAERVGAARAGSLPAAGGCADACPRRLDDDEGHSYAEGANGAGNRVKPLQIA